MQCIKYGLGVLLPNALALIGVQLLDLALDVVDLGELLQREPGKLAFVRRMQVEEFAPGSGPQVVRDRRLGARSGQVSHNPKQQQTLSYTPANCMARSPVGKWSFHLPLKFSPYGISIPRLARDRLPARLGVPVSGGPGRLQQHPAETTAGQP